TWLRLPYYWTELGNVPASATAFLWGSVTLGLVPAGAMLLYTACCRFTGFPQPHYPLRQRGLTVVSYSVMGGVGAAMFHAWRIRASIESLGWPYLSQEVVIGMAFSGLMSLAAFLALVWPGLRPDRIRRRWLLMQIPLAVLSTGLVSAVGLLVAPHTSA